MEIKKALLVASFGTSYRDNCEKTIGAVERTLKEAYPDYELKRAFTSKMIRAVLDKRDGVKVDSVAEALERLLQEGVRSVVIQPTHIMNGEEYESIISAAKPFECQFEQLECGAPILTGIEDYEKTARILLEEIEDWKLEDTAVVLMGHGTFHHANSAYAALEYRLQDEGCQNMFVGTVEGYPDLQAVVKKVKRLGVTHVVLYPFMIAAGDHVNNDMAGGHENSWKNTFQRAGFQVRCVLKGLGEYERIRNIFVEHAGAAMDRASQNEYNKA